MHAFCEYCGGNDEFPQDHCMDCTKPNPWFDIETDHFIGDNPINGFVDQLLWYEDDDYLIVLPYRLDKDGDYEWVDDTKLAFKDIDEIHRFIKELEKTGRKIDFIHSDEMD